MKSGHEKQVAALRSPIVVGRLLRRWKSGSADGAFLPGGRLVALPRVPAHLLAEGFRCAVLDFLAKNEALSEELRGRMLAWRHGGFSAHNEVGVAAEDAEGRKKFAGYMLRAPMSVVPK